MVFVVVLGLGRKKVLDLTENPLAALILVCGESVGGNRHQSGGRHAREPVVVQQVGGELSDSGLATEDASAESGASKLSPEIARVVRGELLLVDRFKNSHRMVLRAHQISARCSLIGEFEFGAVVKALLDVGQHSPQRLRKACLLPAWGGIHANGLVAFSLGFFNLGISL